MTAWRTPASSALLTQAFEDSVSWNWVLLPSLSALPLQELQVVLWTASFHCRLHLPKARNSCSPFSLLPVCRWFWWDIFLSLLPCSLLPSLPELGLLPHSNYSRGRADGRGSGSLTHSYRQEALSHKGEQHQLQKKARYSRAWFLASPYSLFFFQAWCILGNTIQFSVYIYVNYITSRLFLPSL